MFYTFLISGFVPREHDNCPIALGEFRSQAIRAARSVPGHEERLGPLFGFEREGGWAYERSMTRRELVFGVWTSPSAKFDGLVVWAGYEGAGRLPEININLYLCRDYGVSLNEIFKFIRDIIVAAGWTIVREEKTEPLCRQMAGVND